MGHIIGICKNKRLQFLSGLHLNFLELSHERCIFNYYDAELKYRVRV